MPNLPLPPSLPLFPLGTVLFPAGLLPLRVFEVRYLDLIGKCQKAGVPFGIVSLIEGSEVRRPESTERFHSVGTLASIDSVQTPQPGLMLVHCTGGSRFRIERSERLPHGLWTASTSPVADDQPVAVPADLRGSSRALARLFDTLRHRDEVRHLLPLEAPLRLDDCGWVANRWCELLPLPLATKQRLMELDNPLVRLELVSDFLSKNGITPAA